MHFASIAISHTFESDSILHGAIKRFCDYFDWLKISQIIVLMRKFHPIEVSYKVLMCEHLCKFYPFNLLHRNVASGDLLGLVIRLKVTSR